MSLMPPVRHKRNSWMYSDIAMTACEAAVDFDNALFGNDPDVEAAHKLCEWLETWAAIELVGIFEERTQILLNVWHDKFEGRSINGDEAIKEMKDELKPITEILSRLGTDIPFKPPLTREEMETTRDFCLKLSRSARGESYEKEYY
jgi:hypothetical protein